jgi:hypothetical protein
MPATKELMMVLIPKAKIASRISEETNSLTPSASKKDSVRARISR